MNKKHKLLLITGAILLLYILVCIGLNTFKRERYEFFSHNAAIVKGDTWTGRVYYSLDSKKPWKELNRDLESY